MLGGTLQTVDLLTGRTMMGIAPCTFPDLPFREWQERHLASESFTTLGAEQGAFVELDHPGGRGLGLASRVEVYGHVRFTPGQLVGAMLAVVNELTGQTTSGINPCMFPDPTLS